MLHHLPNGRLVFHTAVNLVRQPLPAVFAEDLFQLLFGQLVLFDPLGQAAQILLALALLLLSADDHLLHGRLRNGFLGGHLRLVEDVHLTGQGAELLRGTAKVTGIHEGDLLRKGMDLLL